MAKRLHLKCEVVLMWQFNAPRILHKNQLKNTIFSTIIDYSIQLVKTGRTRLWRDYVKYGGKIITRISSTMKSHGYSGNVRFNFFLCEENLLNRAYL